jgi:hypothetical protein
LANFDDAPSPPTTPSCDDDEDEDSAATDDNADDDVDCEDCVGRSLALRNTRSV